MLHFCSDQKQSSQEDPLYDIIWRLAQNINVDSLQERDDTTMKQVLLDDTSLHDSLSPKTTECDEEDEILNQYNIQP